jgi:hypothetical protein
MPPIESLPRPSRELSQLQYHTCMNLKNFVISGSVQLQTGNLYWDIHNSAYFEGLELIPANDAVVMKWTVPKVENPWGCRENKSSGMKLYFDDLKFLKVNPRDPEMPFTEDACVRFILKVDPDIDHEDPFMRTRKMWGPNDRFRLVFLFQSARQIELESETVELIPVP